MTLKQIESLFDETERAIVEINEMNFVASAVMMHRRLRDSWTEASPEDKKDMMRQVEIGLSMAQLICASIQKLEHQRQEIIALGVRND